MALSRVLKTVVEHSRATAQARASGLLGVTGVKGIVYWRYIIPMKQQASYIF